jgi:Zn-dependent peptidase ImmA (M78 family)
MTSREQVLLDVSRWLGNYTELERMLNEREEFLFAKLSRTLSTKPKSAKRAQDAAKQSREVLGLDEGEGIRDICGLLEERAGIKVCPLPLASDGFFGLSVGEADGGPAIAVNVWDRISVERWIFTAAHELGHLLLHLSAFDVQQVDEDPDEESEADQFASHFLMPHDVFVREWEETWGHALLDRVLKVKRMFRVSYKTVLYRLSEKPTYGADIWKQFQIACKERLGRTLKRTDELQGLRPKDFRAAMVESRAADEPKRLSSDDFVEDRLFRLVRKALHKDKISISRAAEILGLDLKTMRSHAASWVD